MRENKEDWKKQLDTVTLEIAGLNEVFNKHTFRLMQGRLGVYDKRPYDPKTTDPELDGILHQSARLRV